MRKSYVIVALLLALSLLFSMVACQTTTTNPQDTDPPKESDTNPSTDPVTDPVTEPTTGDNPVNPDPAVQMPDAPFTMVFTADFDVEYAVGSTKVTMQFPLTANLELVDENKWKFSAGMEIMESTISTFLYFDGEAFYFNITESADDPTVLNVKVTMDEILSLMEENETDIESVLSTLEAYLEEMIGQLDDEKIAMITVMAESAVAVCNKYITVTEEGTKVITTLNMPKEAQIELINSVFQSAGKVIDEESLALLRSIEVEDLVCSVTVDDSVFSQLTFEWALNNMPIEEGSTVSIAFDINTLFTEAEDLVITAPENFDDFMTLSDFISFIGGFEDPDFEGDYDDLDGIYA